MVVAFVGYIGAYADAAQLGFAPFVAGTLSAACVTFFAFLPSFFFICIGAPFVEATRGNLRFTPASETLMPLSVAARKNGEARPASARVAKKVSGKRKAFLDRAIDLFNERGTRGTPLAEVAENLGLVRRSELPLRSRSVRPGISTLSAHLRGHGRGL
jgi:hypothetical protein